MSNDKGPDHGPYEHTLSEVVRKLRNEPFLFVVAIAVLLIGLVVLATALGSSDLRFIVLVITLLALTVIIGYYMVEVRAQVRTQGERQERQSQEIEWIRLLVELVVSDYERMHLQNLASDGAFWADIRRNSTFEWELRHLLTLGLVDRHPERGIRSLFRDEGRRDVKEHLFITDRGKKYLQLLNQMQSLSHV